MQKMKDDTTTGNCYLNIKKIGYYRPKTNKYSWANVTSIEGDKVFCKDKNSQYHESLSNLLVLKDKPNPDWHGTDAKPLIILK